jgi:hypothetical protein
MGMLSWLFGGADDAVDGAGVAPPDINPATGLPMLDDGVDVMGNPYGFGNPGGITDTHSVADMSDGQGGLIGSPFDDLS